MESDSPSVEQPLALVLFTRQFSAAVDAGFSLVHIMEVLAQNAPRPYNQVAREMGPKLIEGDTLSVAMATMPALFSPFYVNMVRVGEIGGALEVVLRFLADLLEQAWQHSRRSDQATWMLYPSQCITATDWAGLDCVQRCFVLALFCRSLGTMLGSGVPRNLTFEVASALLPDAQHDAVRALVHANVDDANAMIAARDRRLGEATEAFAFLPPLVMEMLALGETDGTLNLMMDKAAEIYEHELWCRLM